MQRRSSLAAALAGAGGEVDELAALSLLDHLLDEGLGHQVAAGDLDIEHALEDFWVEFDNTWRRLSK